MHKNSLGVFKAAMIPVTVVALILDSEIFGNIVALIWLAWALWQVFKAAVEGGAFD